MRIVVDVTPLSHPRTGIGNYTLGMLGGLLEASADEDEVVAFAPAGPRGRRRLERALAGLEVERRLLTVPPSSHTWRTAWSVLGRLPVERLVGELDVFHFSDWMFPPQRGGVRATTVYDLITLRFPEWVAPRTRRMHGRKYANAARTCDVIFAISSFTAGEVTELLGVSEERVRIAHPGVHARYTADGAAAELGGPYVFAVSTVEPRKNLVTLAAAFSLVRARRPELQLVLAGPAGWAADSALAETEGLKTLGFVPDGELPALYRGASAFAYPSLFEGFGIPIVEAMACGAPVVASSHPSLDDACGNAAVRAEPASAEALASGIETALAERERLVPRGIAHASRFTWGACGRAILDGYRSAL